MLGSIADHRVFEDLVATHLPDIHAHFELISMPLALVSFPWFLCLFVGFLPLEVRPCSVVGLSYASIQATLRVWDVFFYEGFETVFHFKVALAILLLNQDTIMEAEDGIVLVTELKRTATNADQLIAVGISTSCDVY